MIDLKNIHEMWTKDSVIDANNLFEASRLTPMLHAKYLEILTTYKLQLKRIENEQKVLLKNKWLYYNGKMSQDELEQTGWEPDPFNGLKIMKGEMEYYYD